MGHSLNVASDEKKNFLDENGLHLPKESQGVHLKAWGWRDRRQQSQTGPVEEQQVSSGPSLLWDVHLKP